MSGFLLSLYVAGAVPWATFVASSNSRNLHHSRNYETLAAHCNGSSRALKQLDRDMQQMVVLKSLVYGFSWPVSAPLSTILVLIVGNYGWKRLVTPACEHNMLLREPEFYRKLANKE